METTTEQAPPPTPPPATRIGPIAGMAAVAASFGFSELLAGLIDGVPSLIVGVATLVIDSVPKPVRDFAISLFGTADKLALGIGIVVVGLAIGAWVGSRANRSNATVVFAGFGLFGALAASRTAEAGLVVSLIGGAVAAGVGLFMLRGLLALGDRTAAAPIDDGRRAFLVGATSTFVVSLLAGLIGRSLSESTTETW